jgi:hypothetical protein
MQGVKREENFYLSSFFFLYNILNLEVERKPTLLPVSNGLQPGEDLGGEMHTPLLILRYSKSTREETSSLIERNCIEMELSGL